MKTLISFVRLFLALNSFSQTTILGNVTDVKSVPIEGVNVYLEGSYDGGTTDTSGQFFF